MNNLNVKRLREICQDLVQAEKYIHAFVNEQEKNVDWVLDTEAKKDMSYYRVSQLPDQYFHYVYFNVEFSVISDHKYINDVDSIFSRQKDLYFHIIANNKDVRNFCSIYSLPFYLGLDHNFIFGNFTDINVAASVFKSLITWWLSLGHQNDLPELDIF